MTRGANHRRRRCTRIRPILGLGVGFLCAISSPALSMGLEAAQGIIDKQFSGLTIVHPDLISEIENGTQRSKGRTLIRGDFNGDGREDFSAMVTRTDGAPKVVSGQLSGMAICLSTGKKQYDCGVVAVGSIGLPFGFYLEAVKPGRMHCYDSAIEVLTKDLKMPNEVKELGERTIRTKSTSVGWFRTLGNGDVVYVYRPQKQLLSCVITD